MITKNSIYLLLGKNGRYVDRTRNMLESCIPTEPDSIGTLQSDVFDTLSNMVGYCSTLYRLRFAVSLESVFFQNSFQNLVQCQ